VASCANLATICAELDDFLRVGEIPDYPNALNGLQLENEGGITRIGAAVDASGHTIAEAVTRGIDLLLVHHGLFWGGLQRMTGGQYRQWKSALFGGVAVYSAHLPLDVHPEVGNNALLCRALELGATTPFFDWKGIDLGLRARVVCRRDELVARLEAAVGGSVTTCPGGPTEVREVGVITGGAGAEVRLAASAGIDTFITGEGPHWTFALAEELGVNILYGGHYATETFGVKALAARVAARHELPWEFIDHPTGL
jgi:dinuclear metal center YbgI/SA1388 family protein